MVTIWAAASKKVSWRMHKMCEFVSSCMCTKYHLGFRSPVHTFCSTKLMILLVDREGPDQTM